MHADVTDQKVLGYLGRALSLELSAVQLYSTQARLVSNWGLGKAAERLAHEAREETEHAERIIARMLALGVAPGASHLRPVTLGSDLASLLKFNRDFELELVGLYQDATSYCARAGLGNDQLFFHSLLSEEQQHAAELEEWIASFTEIPGPARRDVMRRAG